MQFCMAGLDLSNTSYKHKKAQLSLGKTRYNYCCSIDLEGHPRSMIFITSERAYATSY